MAAAQLAPPSTSPGLNPTAVPYGAAVGPTAAGYGVSPRLMPSAGKFRPPPVYPGYTPSSHQAGHTYYSNGNGQGNGNGAAANGRGGGGGDTPSSAASSASVPPPYGGGMSPVTLTPIALTPEAAGPYMPGIALPESAASLNGAAAPARRVPDPAKYKTDLCRSWQATGACSFRGCAFAHGSEELRPLPHAPFHRNWWDAVDTLASALRVEAAREAAHFEDQQRRNRALEAALKAEQLRRRELQERQDALEGKARRLQRWVAVREEMIAAVERALTGDDASLRLPPASPTGPNAPSLALTGAMDAHMDSMLRSLLGGGGAMA